MEQVMEATHRRERKICRDEQKIQLTEAGRLWQSKCSQENDVGRQVERNKVYAECRLKVERAERDARIAEKRQSEQHCQGRINHNLAQQREELQQKCQVDSQVAVQHAVLLTVKAGDEALEAAASGAEGECRAREGREYDRGKEEEQI